MTLATTQVENLYTGTRLSIIFGTDSLRELSKEINAAYLAAKGYESIKLTANAIEAGEYVRNFGVVDHVERNSEDSTVTIYNVEGGMMRVDENFLLTVIAVIE